MNVLSIRLVLFYIFLTVSRSHEKTKTCNATSIFLEGKDHFVRLRSHRRLKKYWTSWLCFNIHSEHKQMICTWQVLCCAVRCYRFTRQEITLVVKIRLRVITWTKTTVEAKVVPQVLFILLSSTLGLEHRGEKLRRLSDYPPSICSVMTEKQHLDPDWCWWRPAAPGLILSPLPGARLSLASAKGHRYAVPCPCPTPAYLIGGQERPCRACQEPLSAGPRHRTQGPTLAPLLFEALGRLIGLLCTAPLWGSAQACSSCWVCRRRKEQQLIPLQVSLSVATLHFQWLRKVTSAPDQPAQEPNSSKLGRHLEIRTADIFAASVRAFARKRRHFLDLYDECIYQCCNLDPKHPFAHINPLDDPAATAEQSNTHPHNAVY